MRVRSILPALVLLALGVAIGFMISGPDSVPSGPPAAAVAGPTVQPLSGGLTDVERRNIEIFRRASPATVFIHRLALMRRSPFSLDVTQLEEGAGTGFVWDTQGHIVTNFHVVQGSDRSTQYRVSLADGSEADAVLVGVAPGKDLAVLRMEDRPERLMPLELGSSDDLAVGQTVLALGNPFGLDQTLTVGVISALGRDLIAPDGRTIRDVIQTDAAINPGNSGGPLLDSSGRLVGVNTAIKSPSGAFAGIGLAIPVETVRRLVPQLIRHGEPIRPGIGVNILSDRLALRYGFEGIVVTEVVPGMPAEQAGIEPVRVDRAGRAYGDVIVAVNGQRVRRLPELEDAFEEAGGVGASVTLTLLNQGRRREVRVRLVEINR